MSWRDTLERAIWTGIQAPAAVAIFDYVDTTAQIPNRTLLYSAAIAFGLSAVKTVARDRLQWLNKKRGRHVS